MHACMERKETGGSPQASIGALVIIIRSVHNYSATLRLNV